MYVSNFVSNADGKPYTSGDFDVRSTTGAQGEISNPKPVGERYGTLGWYYSSNNTTEPLAPVSDFPYTRSFVLEGPNLKVIKSALMGRQSTA